MPQAGCHGAEQQRTGGRVHQQVEHRTLQLHGLAVVPESPRLVLELSDFVEYAFHGGEVASGRGNPQLHLPDVQVVRLRLENTPTEFFR